MKEPVLWFIVIGLLAVVGLALLLWRRARRRREIRLLGHKTPEWRSVADKLPAGKAATNTKNDKPKPGRHRAPSGNGPAKGRVDASGLSSSDRY